MSLARQPLQTIVMEDVKTEKQSQPKRKIKNQAEWKREKRKRSIIAGLSHYSVKGEFVSRKEIGSDCKCKLKCYEKVDIRMRQMLFEGFYSLKSYDEQNAYLFGLIRKHDVKRKKNVHSDRRTCTYKYFVRNQGKEVQVCKMAFAHIHAVSFRKIRTLSEKLDQNILFPRDGRGKHDNRPTKTSAETLELIKKHILNVFKSGEFKKFIREDKNHLMAPELNVAKLYLHFLQTYEQGAVDIITGQLNPDVTPKVKSWLYRKVFQEEIKCNSLLLKVELDSLVETDAVEREMAYTETNCLRNRSQNSKSRRKGTVSKLALSTTCRSDLEQKLNILPDKESLAKRENVELSNMHFTTVNSIIDDIVCKDTIKPSFRTSQNVNSSVGYTVLEDSLNQKCNKINLVHHNSSMKCVETFSNCSSQLSPSFNNSHSTVSNFSVQGFSADVSTANEIGYSEQLEASLSLFQTSNEKIENEIISSADNIHTFYS